MHFIWYIGQTHPTIVGSLSNGHVYFKKCTLSHTIHWPIHPTIFRRWSHVPNCFVVNFKTGSLSVTIHTWTKLLGHSSGMNPGPWTQDPEMNEDHTLNAAQHWVRNKTILGTLLIFDVPQATYTFWRHLARKIQVAVRDTKSYCSVELIYATCLLGCLLRSTSISHDGLCWVSILGQLPIVVCQKAKSDNGNGNKKRQQLALNLLLRQSSRNRPPLIWLLAINLTSRKCEQKHWYFL